MTDLPATTEPAKEIDTRLVLPLLSADEMARAIQAYQNLQKSLDASMPDQIMSIRGRKFRKKGYWRSIRTAFGLSVACTADERITTAEDWGYRVTYRATSPGGNFADGDGTCMASEKTYSGDASQATEHNIRSHAHTRAFNRAVSNLVGFGEVSAEEMRQTGDNDDKRLISAPQAKRLWAICQAQKVPEAALRTEMSSYGFQSMRDITRDVYEALCEWAKNYDDIPQEWPTHAG